MHPLMVLIHPLLVLIRGIEGGALASTTGAKAWIGGAHRVEYSLHLASRKETAEEMCPYCKGHMHILGSCSMRHRSYE